MVSAYLMVDEGRKLTPGRLEFEYYHLQERVTRRSIWEMGEATEEVAGKRVGAFSFQR